MDFFGRNKYWNRSNAFGIHGSSDRRRTAERLVVKLPQVTVKVLSRKVSPSTRKEVSYRLVGQHLPISNSNTPDCKLEAQHDSTIGNSSHSKTLDRFPC